MNNTSKKILITGGAGFIGHHLVEHILKNTNWTIVILDRYDNAGNPNRLTDIEIWDNEKHRVRLFYWDLKAELNSDITQQMLSYAGKIEPFDYIVHMAASSHVDRSITNPLSFVEDNVLGTARLLEWVRYYGDYALEPTGKFLYFSTDEVFGPAPEGHNYKEWERMNPNNPYAATKAGGELLCQSYANTYKMPIIVTHCMNVFGERQSSEKFVPMCIKKILANETITIHANKDKTKAGTRFYLHTRNVCDAVLYILNKGTMLNGTDRQGKYNIVGDKEVSNLEMAQIIAEILKKELRYEMVDFHSSRPGHDLRYGLDGTLLKELGWIAPVGFDESLKRTVEWTVKRKEQWLL